MSKGVYPRSSPTERFEAMFMPEPNSGCWLWTAGLDKYGYGKFKINYRTIAAHRMSYILRYGEIPADVSVLHSCDLRCCVNPEHLWLGTPDDNSKDMVRKDRQAKHEKNGRAKLTEENVNNIRLDRTSLHKDIAAKYGVTRGMISHIKRGVSWI